MVLDIASISTKRRSARDSKHHLRSALSTPTKPHINTESFPFFYKNPWLVFNDRIKLIELT